MSTASASAPAQSRPMTPAQSQSQGQGQSQSVQQSRTLVQMPSTVDIKHSQHGQHGQSQPASQAQAASLTPILTPRGRNRTGSAPAVTADLRSVLNPSRFVFGAMAAPSTPRNSMDLELGGSGSDREGSTPRHGDATPSTPMAATPSHAALLSAQQTDRGLGSSGAAVKKKEEERMEGEEGDAGQKSVDRVRENLARLNQFVASLPEKIAPLTQQIEALELRKQKEIKTREDLPRLQRIQAVQKYLKAVRSMLIHRVEERLLVARMRQMNEYFQSIPPSERNERSIVEAWNAMFDVHAIVPKQLAKDHCDYCRKPLLLIRKQAQLQCQICARMTDHLMPIAHANAWMKTNINAQPENKRIKSVQAKLNQFRAGTPPIPPEITLGVRHALKSRLHVSADSIATPGGVASALVELGHDKYVPYSAKIANIVNGHEICELTDDQINEIISRLRVVQFCHNMLASSGRLSSRHFYTNHVVSQIAAIKGWHAIAASFPVQRTRRLLREQAVVWKQLMHYLRQIDTSHDWP